MWCGSHYSFAWIGAGQSTDLAGWPDLLPRQPSRSTRWLEIDRRAPAYLADGADDLEAHGAGLELRPLGFLVSLRVTPLRVNLLLPARHPFDSTSAALTAATGGFLPPAIGFGSPPALPCPAPRARESGCCFAYLPPLPGTESGTSATPSFSTPGLRCMGLAGYWQPRN